MVARTAATTTSVTPSPFLFNGFKKVIENYFFTSLMTRGKKRLFPLYKMLCDVAAASSSFSSPRKISFCFPPKALQIIDLMQPFSLSP